MTGLFFLAIFGAIAGAAYWAYKSGYGEGMRDGLITGGKLPALGVWAEFLKNPEKFFKKREQTSEEIIREFGGDETKMPWVEFVSRHNAALRREGRDNEQIEAIPKEAQEIPKILQ